MIPAYYDETDRPCLSGPVMILRFPLALTSPPRLALWDRDPDLSAKSPLRYLPVRVAGAERAA